MIKALKFITLLGVLFVVYSCKNKSESKPNINDNESEEIVDEMYKTADPPKAAAIKQGEVVFGVDTFEVIEEETDDMSIVSQFTYGDNGQKMMTTKYREKVFYLINKKTNDTVTIQKQMF